MIPSQMLKGTLEGCVLKVISREETYGYEISQKLRQYGLADISEGTIYPLLLRLERGGLIAATHRVSPAGPSRKYFHITPAGRAELALFEGHWQEMAAAVGRLLRGGNRDEER